MRAPALGRAVLQVEVAHRQADHVDARARHEVERSPSPRGPRPAPRASSNARRRRAPKYRVSIFSPRLSRKTSRREASIVIVDVENRHRAARGLRLCAKKPRIAVAPRSLPWEICNTSSAARRPSVAATRSAGRPENGPLSYTVQVIAADHGRRPEGRSRPGPVGPCPAQRNTGKLMSISVGGLLSRCVRIAQVPWA